MLGIIPGSMGTPGYVVRGKGVAASLNSAAHGAGRRMSRTQAKEMFTWDDAQRFLRERGVTLLSAGLDEVPMAYKDIDDVMAAQSDLGRAARALRSAPGQDGPERRAAGGLVVFYPRGFAPRTPQHALSRAAAPARSVRVAHSLPLAR